MSNQTLPAAVQALTYRQLVDLFRILGGGTVGFDYSKYKLADLRAILIDWIYVRGAFTADYVESVADTVAAAVHAPALPQPSLPSPPLPLPSRPAPVAGTPEPFSAPALTPQPQIVALDEFAARSPVPAPTRDAGMFIPNVGAPVPLPQIEPQPLPQPFGVASPLPLPQNAPDAVLQPLPSAPIPATYPCVVHASVAFPEFAAQFPADAMVTLYGNPEAPAVDPDYQFHYGHVAQAVIALAATPTYRLWLGGPRGTGKTKFAEQIAARLSRPFFRVNFNRATEASEIVGDTGLRDGNTHFVYGPVAAAAVTPGALLLLDELSYGSPGNVASLNAILERKGAHLRLPRTDQTLIPADGFAIFVADNTFGFGDTTGDYASRNPIGIDTRDRVGYALEFGYLDPADEAKLLRAMVKRDVNKILLKPVAAAIVAVVGAARQTASDGNLPGAPSVRGAAAFATLLACGIPVADAFTSAIVRNAPLESAEKLRQIFAANWPSDMTADANGNAPKFTS